MKDNWLIREARKADYLKDYAVLENPAQKEILDDLLMEFWNGFKNKLESYEYASLPSGNIEIMTEESYILTRYFEFMLFFDEGAFFRGTLSCSKESWMIQSVNFIPLSIENDPKVIFEILGNSRFVGNPPNLRIDKEHPEEYYQINFDHGYGASWGLKNKKKALQEVLKVIDTSVQMYELTNERVITTANLGEFISTAYEVYEAY